MTAIAIRRWRTRYHAERPLRGEELSAWNAALGDVDLDAGLGANVADEELVCIRLLKLRARLGEDAGRGEALEAWRASLAAHVLAALRDEGSGNVVRYRDRADAMADLLYRASAGDLRRTWAWRQAGLVDRGEAQPARPAILAAAVAALASEPAAIWPVLMRLLLAEGDTGAWSALLGALGEPEWDRLLDASPRTHAAHRAVSESLEPCESMAALAANRTTAALRAWVVSHPTQARRRRAVLAALLAAAAQPEAAYGMAASERAVRAALAAIDRDAPGPVGIAPAETPAPRSGRAGDAREAPWTRHVEPPAPRAETPSALEPIGERESAGADATGPDRAESEATMPEAPALPRGEEAFATEWAGLLFLLNLVEASGLVASAAALDARESLPVQGLQRALHRLAVAHFGVPREDPAVRAFCGGEDVPDAPDPVVEALALSGARAMSALLRERLPAAPEDDPGLVERICRRRGTLTFAPGWIALHLAADNAEADLRRAALDLDPGWIPWLGCVMRFHYE
ncbi:hypothetical protein BWI17_06310 [Betaproteobacteria bacterium GR16-43]|nr:hypothetical protein BWI17_06310 [Betaproteobacteria bacterium GR16-43]